VKSMRAEGEQCTSSVKVRIVASRSTQQSCQWLEEFTRQLEDRCHSESGIIVREGKQGHWQSWTTINSGVA
jgi:hypothetical protein